MRSSRPKLSDYGYHKCAYFVGKEKYSLTIWCDKKELPKHIENLGLLNEVVDFTVSRTTKQS